jgi:hypothetical protein
MTHGRARGWRKLTEAVNWRVLDSNCFAVKWNVLFRIQLIAKEDRTGLAFCRSSRFAFVLEFF